MRLMHWRVRHGHRACDNRHERHHRKPEQGVHWKHVEQGTTRKHRHDEANRAPKPDPAVTCGVQGRNNKGLVTFDRKTKKDSFYLYKAWWSDEAFVHICSKRFVERTGSTATVKVYSNQSTAALYVNGNKVGEQTGEHVFTFKVPLNGELHIQAVAGDRTDESVIRHVDTPNPEYKLHKTKSKSANWV